MLGALAAITFSIVFLIGLAQARRIPSASNAGGPMSAAWALSLASILHVGAVVLFAILGLVTEEMEPEDLVELYGDSQVMTLIYGFGASLALYNGARRTGRALKDGTLASFGLVTLILVGLMQLVVIIVSDEDLRDGLDIESGILVLVVTAFAAVMQLILVIMTLGAFRRALTRRTEEAVSEPFGGAG